MEKLNYDDLGTDKLNALIRSRSSFEVIGLSGRMGSAIQKIENVIEPAGCKVQGVHQGTHCRCWGQSI